MSSAAPPISPARFALAIKDLPLSTLSLKASEIRNSIAHLDYSNEQLKPFAEAAEPDQDCVDAIHENEIVITRMLERIDLLKQEVESRGVSWAELGGEVAKEEEGVERIGRREEERSETDQRSQAWRDGTFTTGRIVNGDVVMDDATPSNTAAPTSAGTNGVTGVNGETANGVNGVHGTSAGATGNAGGSLDDESLRRAIEERLRNLGNEGQDDEEEEGGMHL